MSSLVEPLSLNNNDSDNNNNSSNDNNNNHEKNKGTNYALLINSSSKSSQDSSCKDPESPKSQKNQSNQNISKKTYLNLSLIEEGMNSVDRYISPPKRKNSIPFIDSTITSFSKMFTTNNEGKIFLSDSNNQSNSPLDSPLTNRKKREINHTEELKEWYIFPN
jgi:hypothetical protein